MRVAVVGTGYVGLTTAVSLAYLGHSVAGLDVDSLKVEMLSKGRSPIHEPGVELLLQTLQGTIHFTTEFQSAIPNADVVIIAVGTPSRDNGEADLSYVMAAATQVAEVMQPDHTYTVVVKSTVPIGTNRMVAERIRHVISVRGIRAEVSFASNPEFLREGLALLDTFYPDRIVIGTDCTTSIEVLTALYRPLLHQDFVPPKTLPRPANLPNPSVVTTDTISAEMIKYGSNAFLALKISYANELAGLCERVGADITEVTRGMGLDQRIGPRFLGAGIGWGGSCFPKDTAALIAMSQDFGYSMPITEAVRTVNQRQRLAVVEKLQALLKSLRGRTIGILGLAFKPETDDVRESPAIEIIRLLLERGALVRVHDPVAMPNARRILVNEDVCFCTSAYEVARQSDGLVLATEWPEYTSLDLSELAHSMRIPYLVDGRNVFSPDEARKAGFYYNGIGR